jgi:hypothetical protein
MSTATRHLAILRFSVTGGATLGFRHTFLQSAARFALVGFVLGANPIGVFVA